MPKVGIEPTFPKEHDFESCASAYSATSAKSVEDPALAGRPKVYHSQHEGQDKITWGGLREAVHLT